MCWYVNHEKKQNVNTERLRIIILKKIHIANKIGPLTSSCLVDPPSTVVEPPLPSRHFAQVNNVYDIELGHKSRDHCLIRNIKHWGTGRKVLLADCCIAYTKIKPLKCKVVEPLPCLSEIKLFGAAYFNCLCFG